MQIIVRILLHSALLLPCAAQTILKSSAELPLPGSMSKQEFHPFVFIGAEDGISNVTMVYGGDVNADGSISLPDALTIMRSAMGIIPQLELDDADINADDAVQLDDAIVLARLCLGIE